MVFGINKQNMTRLDTERISSGAKNFVKFKINFSAEWDGYTKTVIFTRTDRSESFYVYNAEHEKEYYVPSEAIAKEGVCFVNVIGTNGESKIATSNSCFFCIESAASGETDTESEITASLFAQMCARIEAAISQYFSKEIVLSADENAVYWKYRDETETKVLFTFDSININNEIVDCSKVDIDISDSHIIWTKGNGKWEELIELSKLKGDKGSKGDRGFSGVYVGSGEMPTDCNVQIDPNGEATDISPENIAIMEKRLTIAEKALKGQLVSEEINDSTALFKYPPENVLSYAAVNEVGGMTRKDETLGELKSAKVQEIVSTGRNLFPAPEGFTYTTTANGTNIGTRAMFSKEMYIPAGAVTISFEITQGGTTSVRNTPVIYKTGLSRYFDTSENMFLTAGYYSRTITIAESGYYRLGWWDNANTVPQTISKIMLNRGSTALPYEPYKEIALHIPEAVQAIDGYGLGVSDTVYNYIDFEKQQFVKKVGYVDMGTLSWDSYSSSTPTTYCAIAPGIKKPAIYDERGTGVLCVKYATVANSVATMSDKSIMRVNGNYSVFVNDTDYTDAASFKSAMSGVMLYYELAEPVITDISDILSPDNMLEVYEGGTVEVVTDDEYAESVPTKITFQSKNEFFTN